MPHTETAEAFHSWQYNAHHGTRGRGRTREEEKKKNKRKKANTHTSHKDLVLLLAPDDTACGHDGRDGVD